MTKLQKILVILGAIPVEHSGKKKCDYMKAKDYKLEKNSKNKKIGKCIRGLMNSRRAINLALM